MGKRGCLPIHSRGKIGIRRNRKAARDAPQYLRHPEAINAGIAERTYIPAVPHRAKGLRGVFNQQSTRIMGPLHYWTDVARITEQVRVHTRKRSLAQIQYP